MTTTKQQTKGFTIIEVVLVLAIAAFIFLMIFIAWPALQRSQRDDARKHDAQIVASAIGSWRSNHNGKNPLSATDFTAFKTNYLSDLSQYDRTSATEVVLGNGTTTFPVATKFSVMNINMGTKCDTATNKSTTTGASSRQASIVILVESGDPTNGVLFCQDA